MDEPTLTRKLAAEATGAILGAGAILGVLGSAARDAGLGVATLFQ